MRTDQTHRGMWLLAGLAAAWIALPAPAQTIMVAPVENAVWGNGWPAEGAVHVIIGDPADPDFTAELNANADGDWTLWNIACDIQPGHTVRVECGEIVRTHEVTALAISLVDVDADTIHGTAEPGRWVDVHVFHHEGVGRHVQADGNGDWIADFSVPVGDGAGWNRTIELGPGLQGEAQEWDGAGHATVVRWRVAFPHFRVNPVRGHLWGHEWAAGETVTVTVGEPGDLLCTAKVDAWGTWGSDFDHDLQPGDLLRASCGEILKDHVITSLTLDHVDPDTDTVSGTAEPGSWVTVEIYDPWVRRHVEAGTNGQWVADFSAAAGPDPWDAPFDITEDTEIHAYQEDDDRDATYFHWRMARPQFRVDPVSDQLWGHEWPAGERVTITRDDPPQELGTAQADARGGWWFDSPVNIQAGDLLRVASGDILKEHEVTELSIAGVDPDADTVSGFAAPFSEVEVWVHDADARRSVQADAMGQWTADFSIAFPGVPGGNPFDIQEDTRGTAAQADEDFDETHVHWRVIRPIVGAHLTYHRVWGEDWPSWAAVQLTIGDPGDPDVSLLVHANAWGHWWFELWQADCTLNPGDLITADDGAHHVSMTVAPLSVTGADPLADTISGTAPPDRQVEVHIGEAHVDAQSGPSGEWTAHFAGIADIEEGTEGIVRLYDANANITEIAWRFETLRLDEIEAGLLWLASGEMSEFEFWLEGGGILSARFQPPGGAWHDMVLVDWWAREWTYRAYEAACETLDARFPPGTYVLELAHYEGVATTTIEVDAAFQMPAEQPVLIAPLEDDLVGNPVTLAWHPVTDPAADTVAVFLGDDDPDPVVVNRGDSEFGPFDLVPGPNIAGVLFAATDFDLENDDRMSYQVVKARWTAHEFTVGYRLNYQAGPGGALHGPAMQVVAPGGDAEEVEALPEPGARFSTWSDGRTESARRELAVSADLSVEAGFDSAGGVPIRWYAGHMIEPEAGEDWSDVDSRYDPSKRMTLVDQYTANTDPNDPQSIFRILSLQAAPFVTLHFHAAPDRLYRLQSTLDLARPETWANVPGAVLSGHGGPGSIMDTNQPPLGTSYRLSVEVPAP